MYTKGITTLAIILSLIFTSCASKNSSDNGGQGTQAGSTIFGALAGMSAVYLGNTIRGVETTKEEIVAGAVVGGLAGFIIGSELSKMQKRYKSKEKRLIEDIIKIDKESAELAGKNRELSSKLNTIESKILQLRQDRNLKQRDKSRLRAKLRANRQDLRTLISKNRQISKKIYRSKSKAKKYNYSSKDRQNILSDINKLDNNSRQYERKLNSKVSSIDKMLKELA